MFIKDNKRVNPYAPFTDSEGTTYTRMPEHLYQEMISNGVAKECAREILPLATPTRLYANGTIRSWITYIALREKHGTQREHQVIAKDIKTIFCGQLPSIAEALGGADNDWEI